MMIQPSELKDIIGVGAVWALAVTVAYSGYALSRRIQKRRFAGYASEPEIVEPNTYQEIINSHEQWHAECARQHEAWQIANWKRVPHLDRLRCTTRLWRFIPPDLVNKWVKQKAEGHPIACDDVWFHHGYGMAIRNELRAALPDDRLPPVEYSSGDLVQNWDDFYRGALNDMIEQAVVAFKVGKAA